jgi:hypothetical protein
LAPLSYQAKPYRAEAMMAELHSLVGRAAPSMQAKSRAMSRFAHTSLSYQA